MRKTLLVTCILVICTLILIGLLVRFGGTPWRNQAFVSQSVKAQRPAHAFTATRSVAVFQGSNLLPVATRIETVAVRGDGSRAEFRHVPNPSGSGRTLYFNKITDVPGRRLVVVEPLGESVTTYPLNPKAVEFHATKPFDQCEGEPAGKIVGYDVMLAQTTRPLPPARGEIKIQAWLAPALDCFPLRRETSLFWVGRDTQLTVESVVALIEGEPEGSLFEIPAAYVERSPSEAMAEAKRKYPNLKDLGGQPSQPRLDEAYFHHRQPH